MKARLHLLFVALGLATLAFVWIPGPLNRDTFYWAGRPVALFLPSILDFVLAWWLLALVLYRMRSPGRARNVLWSGIIAFAPVLAMESYALLPGTYLSSHLRFFAGLLGLLAWLLLVTVLSGFFARHAERTIHAASVVLLFLSINGSYVLAHSVWLGWQARHLNALPAAKPPLHPAIAGRPRIVWVVLDELSYQQVYGRRLPGLSLPAFDALATQATIFTNTKPAADMTEFSMPDYLTGIPDGHDIYAPDGQLDISRLDIPKREHFNQFDTIFYDAQRRGYNTGLSGWFIPYCRLMPSVIDRCTWRYGEPNRNGMTASSGVFGNLAAPIRRIAAYMVPSGLHTRLVNLRSNSIYERQQHIDDYRSISIEADKLLLDPRIDFMLLHLPVPHLPGVYDRHTSAFDPARSHGYIDNLALADSYVAHLRSTLESIGAWDTTTVLIMGDHGWRLTSVGPDDEAARVGGFDPRPGYIVKFAGQHQPRSIDAPFDALRTRALLQALVQQQIRTPDDLAAWVEHPQ